MKVIEQGSMENLLVAHDLFQFGNGQQHPAGLTLRYLSLKVNIFVRVRFIGDAGFGRGRIFERQRLRLVRHPKSVGGGLGHVKFLLACLAVQSHFG